MSKTKPETGPDVRQIRSEELPQVSFPGGRKQSFRVFLEPDVHKQVWSHSTEDVSVEICGVLVGKWARDADGPFALISESIRGEAATNKFAEVTFTHDTWAKINQEMDTKFSNLKIVGWYHSHPGFGIFLSERDRFIQDHFFSGPGQLAYVVDPLRKTEGVFRWEQGKPVLCPYYWVGDGIQVATAAGEEPASHRPAGVEEQKATTQPATPDDKGGSWWLPLLGQVAMLILVFLLGYILAGRLTDWERIRIEQGALARSLLYLKIRPGLREELELVKSDLDDVAKRTSALAKEHIKSAAEPKEVEAAWREVLARLDQDGRLIRKVQMEYGLNPQESGILQVLGEASSAAPATPAGGDKPKDKQADEKKKE